MSTLDRLSAALSRSYRLERELGQGGMATVYLAEDLKHRRQVAIKVLSPELAAALGGERFLREIETTAGLQHPHILALYDSGRVADGQAGGAPTEILYYVMPYVEGESLRDRMSREKQLPIEDALQITREVADALGYAHARGIVHRDIKPENILLSNGHAVVADFGIAKAVTEAGGDTLTQTGMAIGTPHYMSPEQASAEPVDGRSDLYALGCVLYEMLAGEPPYTGPTAQAIVAKRMLQPVPHVAVMRDTVPQHVDQVLTRALAKSPADRFATASEFMAALQGTGSGSRGFVPGTPGWRTTATRAVAVVAVLAIAALAFLKMPRRGEVVPVSPDVIAVVPFAVRGPAELAYLGEGMVDLLSAKLDGAGSLRAVNPRVVIALIAGEQVDIADPVAARQVAERLGAGRYVTGDVLEAGGRIQITAYLHEQAAAGAPRHAVAEGRADALFDMVDSLARALVTGTLPDSMARLQKLATTTTGSLPALKHYLDGERLIRAGQYREASTAYEAAIAIDTNFALAYYRKSLVAEWIDAFDPRSSADKAFEHAARLSPRDRSLLAALRLRRRGETTEAERAYRAHLNQWPDEVEALIQLAEIQFHDNPRRGRSMADGIPLFEQALVLEPSNANARIHLARLYALFGQLDSLDANVRHFEADAAANALRGEGDQGEERLFEVQAVQAYTIGDTVEQERLVREMKGKPGSYWFLVAHGVSRFARDPAGAQAMVAQRTTDSPLLDMLRSNFFAVRGQHEAFRRFLDSIPGGRTAQWDLLEAFVWTSGAMAPDTTRMKAVLDRLRTVDPAAILRDDWVPAYEDLTADFHRFELGYHRALLLIQLGRAAEARREIVTLEAIPPLPFMGDLQSDALKSLDAELRYQAGDLDGALAVLRTITYEAPHGATYHAFADGTRSRFLRAELELQRGDREVARGLFRGLDESWSPFDIYHRPVAYQRLGEIAEADGRTAEAIEWYSRLIDLWRDADPSLVPMRTALQQHREDLRGPR